MNTYNINELSSSSESDGPYLVDSRYCRTTIRCKRKSLKKTIKLIHGRCVVIYRGTGDLLPIAAKDADRNCYCDFVFVCHDPKSMSLAKHMSAMPQSGSALHDSSISEDDNDDKSDKKIFQQRFVSSNSNQRLSEKDSFLFPKKINEYNNNENSLSFITSERESRIKNNSSTTCIDTNETETSKEQLIIEDIDVDVDELIDADEPSVSIVYFPSTHTKPISNIFIDKSR
ncbi:unnamed protein product [Rotaria socialis]|uniref:Uncharacterized protein n=3 Tax=Rotaria socialis TaxID=392032 RepID=A0A817RGP0_9BILA|nr:unnamed protein product [Rotaria socialis]CAF3538839.1 unnamed protein product [Rotaria socialis]CAF4146115.1 unnamed protein product [Rotaria socialis]CAF4629766.1 unnamed protein product [Rotaria socialis]